MATPRPGRQSRAVDDVKRERKKKTLPPNALEHLGNAMRGDKEANEVLVKKKQKKTSGTTIGIFCLVIKELL